VHYRNSLLTLAFIFCFVCFRTNSQSASNNKLSKAAPLMDILHLFRAPDVPAFGPSEIEVPPHKYETVPALDSLPGSGIAEHPMLYFGEGLNKIFIVNKGEIIWTYSTGKGGEYDDVWMLSNGNILFTRMQYIEEVTPKKAVVWHYDAPEGTEIHCCQPIGLDRVLYIRNGLPPKLIVANIKTKEVEVEHSLPAISLTDPKTIHPQFRRVRYTAQGTYLVPFLKMNQVIEYDKDFNEIWKYEIPTPWAAIRLKNGNTLITDEKDRLTREVNPQKEIVWELRPDDLPAEYRFSSTQSCTRLANGNTIICSRGGSGKGPQLVEVTPDKKVVWVLWEWTDIGPATAVQILDDPGIPEIPGESEH
jgi:Mal s 1 allergenic protein-like